MSQRARVLFVCTGNAGRSQMAQAMLGAMSPGKYDVESAGVAPWEALHPMAVRVMGSRGVSMTGQSPKGAESVAGRRFDLVVTIGDPALHRLPHALSSPACWEHWAITDPADADGTAESHPVFERTADAIAARLPALCARLDAITSGRRSGGRVGFSTGMWPRERFGLKTHLRSIVRAGFDAIELCHYQGPHHFDPSDAAAVRDLKNACDDLGVRVWSVHSRDPGSLGSPDAAERQRQIDELHFCLELCEQLGAKVVVSHGLITGRWASDRAEADRLLTDSLDRLLPASLASSASIAFENDTVTEPGRTGIEVIARLRPYPAAAFGFVIDPGHANIAGDLSAIAAHVGRRLISTHLNDNDGRQDIHFVPGEGTVDWSIVRTMMYEASYGGCVMHEVQCNKPGDTPEEALARTMRQHRLFWPLTVPG